MTYLVIYIIGFILYLSVSLWSLYLLHDSISREDTVATLVIAIVGSFLWPLLLAFGILFGWML
jgi:hypothetical protein